MNKLRKVLSYLFGASVVLLILVLWIRELHESHNIKLCKTDAEIAVEEKRFNKMYRYGFVLLMVLGIPSMIYDLKYDVPRKDN